MADYFTENTAPESLPVTKDVQPVDTREPLAFIASSAPAAYAQVPTASSSSSTVQRGIKIDPNTIANMRDTQNLYESAQQGNAEAQIRQLNALAQERERAMYEEDMRRVDHRVKQFEIEEQVAAQNKRVEQLMRERESMNLDPGRVFKGKGGQVSGGKVSGGIFLSILGGIGSGLAQGKTPNYALEAIDRAIDNDILAQKENMAGKDRAIGAAQAQRAFWQQKGLSAEQAYSAERMYRAKDLENRFALVASQTQEPITRTAATIGIAQSRKAYEAEQLKLQEAMQNKVSVSSTQQRQLMPVDEKGRPMAQGAARVAVSKEGDMLKPLDSNKELKTAMQSMAEGRVDLQNWIERAGEIKAANLAGKLTGVDLSTKVQSLEADRERIAAKMRNAVESGVMTDKDAVRYLSTLPSANALVLNKEGAQERMDEAVRGIDRRWQVHVDFNRRDYNLDYVDKVYHSYQKKTPGPPKYKREGEK